MLDALRASRTGYGVHWMRMLKSASAQKDEFLCCFEGEDVKYFGSRIEAIAPEIVWVALEVRGRDNLARLRELAAGAPQVWERSFFFFDRDFGLDVPAIDEHTYVTPCYSVENLYGSSDCFRRVLRDEFGMSPGDARSPDLVESLIANIDARFVEFFSHAKLLNCWMLAHRLRESRVAGTGAATFNDIPIRNLIVVDLTSARSNYSLEVLNALEPTLQPITADEMAEAEGRLEGVEMRVLCRGKLVAYAVRLLIDALREGCSRKPSVLFPEGVRCRLQVSDKNFLSDMSRFADTPACLRAFVREMDVLWTRFVARGAA